MGVPRARRNGEELLTKRADELGQEDLGRIVQHPGNRGFLRGVEPEGAGVWVCTSTGVNVYPSDSEWYIWGP